MNTARVIAGWERKPVRPLASAERVEAAITEGVDRLADRYGLSLAERAIVRIAAMGPTSRPELAIRRGVLPSTLKKQIQSINRKTRKTSLKDVVNEVLRLTLDRIVARLPPELPPDE